MSDVQVTTTETAITGETIVRSITVITFSGTITPAGGAGVTSVNGDTGVVVLTAADVGAATTAQGALADTAVQPGALGTAAAADTGDFDPAGSAAAAQTAAEAYTDAAVAGVGGGAVDSVNGQTGTVVLTAADVGADASGAASAAQAAGEGYTDTAIASEVTRANGAYATVAQGTTADSAVQPGDLATVATTGAYSDLTGKPTIPSTASDVGAVPTTRTVNGHALSADVTVTAADVSAVPTTRTVNSKALSANITLNNTDVGAAATSHTHTESDVTGLTADLAAKAPLASPALTGNPTAPTQTAGNNSTRLATTAYADNAVAKQPEALVFALGDETTAITTGTKVTFRMPFAMTLTSVRASLTTASSSGNPAFDVKESGTTIFSTALTIDATEKTSQTAATAAIISDASLADDAEITLIVSTAGTGAAGAKITFIGTRT